VSVDIGNDKITEEPRAKYEGGKVIGFHLITINYPENAKSHPYVSNRCLKLRMGSYSILLDDYFNEHPDVAKKHDLKKYLKG